MSYIGSKPANKPVVASDLDPAVITGQTALATSPASTDEFLISDAGVLKRLDASLISGGAYTFIKSITASNSASVEFKNGTGGVVLDNTYPYYVLIGYDITVQTDDTVLKIVLSTDAGSSYITSGYDTIVDRIRADTSGVVTSSSSSMELNSMGNSTNEEAAFEFKIFNPSSTQFTKYIFNGLTRDQSARVAHHNGGGMLESAADVDAIKIVMSSGNIVGGVFKLYGITGA